MLERFREWAAALTVLLITAVLVLLDVTDRSVQRYGSRHSFGTSVVSGLLVLLLTVLVVDRVTRMRQLKNQSRAIAAQAAIIVAQGVRTADAIKQSSSSEADLQAAGDEFRAYLQMLLVSAPVLIDAKAPRTFLETAQRVAAQLYRAMREAGDGHAKPEQAQLDNGVTQLQAAAAPLVATLTREQRAAVASEEDGASTG